MPPFRLVHNEALGFHRRAKQVPQAALLISTASVVDMRALGHLVVSGRHHDFFAGFQIKQRQVNRAASIVTRALSRISHELFLVGRRSVPEDLRHRPRPIPVVNDQSVAFLSQRFVRAHESFGGGALKKRASFFVDRPPEKVVRTCVANVELDASIEFDELDEIRLSERAGFFRRLLSSYSLSEGQDREKERTLESELFHFPLRWTLLSECR